ncbi:MAG: hypothetical protein H8F28_18960, partial [Fibrella sp.]|nr:hypothetical protein [Armatimonadota bacterium]
LVAAIDEFKGAWRSLRSVAAERLTKEARGKMRNCLNESVTRSLLARHGNGPATWYAFSVI